MIKDDLYWLGSKYIWILGFLAMLLFITWLGNKLKLYLMQQKIEEQNKKKK